MIGSEQQCLTEDNWQHRIACKRQINCSYSRAALHDAQVLAVRVHQNVSASKVNAIRPKLTSHYQKFVCQRQLIANRKRRQDAFQLLAPLLRRLR